MRRLYAIGDVHGCLGKLDALLEAIGPDPETDRLIFLGDYIDRGENPKGVIDRLLELKAAGQDLVLLKGNHEEMFLDYLAGELSAAIYAFNGGGATLSSYGLMTSEPTPADLPAEHLDLLTNLKLWHEEGGYLFVHAGLKPGLGLEKQRPEDLLWIREEFIYSTEDWRYKIVFGHTPFNEPFRSRGLIGIDTGAVYGGRLTCLVLPEEDFIRV